MRDRTVRVGSDHTATYGEFDLRLAELMRTSPVTFCVLSAVIVVSSAEARAGQQVERPQTGATSRSRTWRVGVGAAVARFEPAHDNQSGSVRIQPLLRVGWQRRGIVPAIEFNWFSTDVKQTIGDRATLAGPLRVRPIMAGIGYRRGAGPLTTGVSLVGGYAFNGFTLNEQARAAYRDRLGLEPTSFKVSNSLALAAAVSLTYDVVPRVTLVGSAGFLVARPHVTIVISGARQTATWNADAIVLKLGVAFRVL